MPIATCYLSHPDDQNRDPSGLAESWAKAAKVDAALLTLTLVPSRQSAGKPTRAMVLLNLPDVWAKHRVDEIQTGLAQALADWMETGPDQVHVITRRVESGFVVEDGKVVEW